MKRLCANPDCRKALAALNGGEHCFTCQRTLSGARVAHNERVAVAQTREARKVEPEPAPEPTAAGLLYVITINGRPTTAFRATYNRKRQAESALRSYRPVVSDRAHYKIIKYRLT